MLGDITTVKNIYIACGYTDMRKSIDGLAGIVKQKFNMDPFSPSLFLFCGRSSNRMKALFWEGDGFVLLYNQVVKQKLPGNYKFENINTLIVKKINNRILVLLNNYRIFYRNTNIEHGTFGLKKLNLRQ
ncbi:MAG: IS66 family insertion sequence element accessory protein TnpB [Acetivibrionales bacterium]|jgi:transposase